jgi:hypothetical protein
MLGPDRKNLEAIGLTAEFGLVSTGAKARMLAKEDPWKTIASSPEFQGAAQSRKLTEGIWELPVANKPQAGAMAAFVLMAFLGFAVYLLLRALAGKLLRRRCGPNECRQTFKHFACVARSARHPG